MGSSGLEKRSLLALLGGVGEGSSGRFLKEATFEYTFKGEHARIASYRDTQPTYEESPGWLKIKSISL